MTKVSSPTLVGGIFFYKEISVEPNPRFPALLCQVTSFWISRTTEKIKQNQEINWHWPFREGWRPVKLRDANPHRMTQHQQQQKKKKALKKKEGTGHSVRVDVPPTYFHNEKEKKREEEEEPAKKVRRTRKQALALHTRARQSALRATMAQAFLLLLLLSSAPARPLFLNRR